MTHFRPLAPGMGQAVAERTVLRRKEGGAWETWGEVAERVAEGSALLALNHEQNDEFNVLRKHIANGSLLMSGRHLQHGDENQPNRNMEVFTNCATAATAFLSFYLLLNGSGVGRAVDDDMMLVNWDYAPTLRCVLDSAHPDFDWANHESERDARHKFGKGKNVIWHTVDDSREGWAKALELWETLTFEKVHAHKMLILVFSAVRAKGSPIGGMQNRPASGPVPLMGAFAKAATLKGAGLAPWLQAMYVDHYFSECVLVGGARRAARMTTKYWRDPTIFDFITVKRPIEYYGKTVDEITAMRAAGPKRYPFLWSSNNSVMVDEEFWNLLQTDDILARHLSAADKELRLHAKRVFDMVCEASYADGTGEPGFINAHKLVQNDTGWTDINRGDYVGSKKYQVEDDTQILLSKLAKRAKKKRYHMIVNPCGEIVLNLLGAFCVIADGVPYHCDTIDEAEEMFRTATRALIRTNTMDSIYGKEVRRTNRIGVGITGIHEFAWKFFGLGFADLIDEEKSKGFWLTIARFKRAVADEAATYSKKLGLPAPHTNTTIKPAGTTSKLFGLTEGWHLPAMRQYLRWVQFRNDDPLVKTYADSGYPTRNLRTYEGTTIVGFPTQPVITTLGMAEKLVTAGEASPEDQFQWLKLGEKYWINGTDEHGEPLTANDGNQISYTLKYLPEVVSFDHFKAMMLEHQSQVRCCSVMPQEDASGYEYQPEQPIAHGEFQVIMQGISDATLTEDIGKEHIDCANGACPVDFVAGDKQ